MPPAEQGKESKDNKSGRTVTLAKSDCERLVAFSLQSAGENAPLTPGLAEAVVSVRG